MEDMEEFNNFWESKRSSKSSCNRDFKFFFWLLHDIHSTQSCGFRLVSPLSLFKGVFSRMSLFSHGGHLLVAAIKVIFSFWKCVN